MSGKSYRTMNIFYSHFPHGSETNTSTPPRCGNGGRAAEIILVDLSNLINPWLSSSFKSMYRLLRHVSDSVPARCSAIARCVVGSCSHTNFKIVQMRVPSRLGRSVLAIAIPFRWSQLFRGLPVVYRCGGINRRYSVNADINQTAQNPKGPSRPRSSCNTQCRLASPDHIGGTILFRCTLSCVLSDPAPNQIQFAGTSIPQCIHP